MILDIKEGDELTYLPLGIMVVVLEVRENSYLVRDTESGEELNVSLEGLNSYDKT